MIESDVLTKINDQPESVAPSLLKGLLDFYMDDFSDKKDY